jgi:cold shock CspA family protein
VLLKDHERSFQALKRAFNANRRDIYIASRLARLYEELDKLDDATKILYDALQSNRGDHQLNFQYASILQRRGEKDHSVLLYHYRRAFTKGDTNYDAQFWFARYAFESSSESERKESKELFQQLRAVPMPFDFRLQVRDVIGDSGLSRMFFGTVARLEYAFGFVARDRSADWVFFHKDEGASEVWSGLRTGLRVSFCIGFSFNGPVALNVATV